MQDGWNIEMKPQYQFARCSFESAPISSHLIYRLQQPPYNMMHSSAKNKIHRKRTALARPILNLLPSNPEQIAIQKLLELSNSQAIPIDPDRSLLVKPSSQLAASKLNQKDQEQQEYLQSFELDASVIQHKRRISVTEHYTKSYEEYRKHSKTLALSKNQQLYHSKMLKFTHTLHLNNYFLIPSGQCSSSLPSAHQPHQKYTFLKQRPSNQLLAFMKKKQLLKSNFLGEHFFPRTPTNAVASSPKNSEAISARLKKSVMQEEHFQINFSTELRKNILSKMEQGQEQKKTFISVVGCQESSLAKVCWSAEKKAKSRHALTQQHLSRLISSRKQSKR